MDLVRFLPALVLGPIGIYFLIKDARSAWRRRGTKDVLVKFELARIASIGVAFIAVLLIWPIAVLFGGSTAVIACMVLAGLGAIGFLVLSAVVGFMEGYKGKRGG